MLQGLADAFILLGLPFDSPEAQQLNKEIFETIYFAGLETSCELAAKDGAFPVAKSAMPCSNNNQSKRMIRSGSCLPLSVQQGSLDLPAFKWCHLAAVAGQC